MGGSLKTHNCRAIKYAERPNGEGLEARSLAQLAGIQFLTRQGLAIRGHTELEGNLP